MSPPPPCPVEATADLLWLWFGPTGRRTLLIESGWSWDRRAIGLHRLRAVPRHHDT
ncbi:hypothetical protein [Streptomyces sp. NBC_00316]|uniref:hypothetical protein n=1 Tax=Streptomyces sp. NBC_00316 TaxID=2975710 RepID=UPI002E28CA62|nr:hypothetical protein [Streptomyces sp. NBC_00316]